MTQLAFDFDEPPRIERRYRATVTGEHVDYAHVLNGSKVPGMASVWGDSLGELREALGRDWCAKRVFYGQECTGCLYEIEVFEQTLDMARPRGERWVAERLLERITNELV